MNELDLYFEKMQMDSPAINRLLSYHTNQDQLTIQDQSSQYLMSGKSLDLQKKSFQNLKLNSNHPFFLHPL